MQPLFATLIVMLYGISSAQIVGEGTIAGMHFINLATLIRGSQNDDEHSIEGMTRKERPFTFFHAFFGMAIAIVGAIRLIYLLFNL